MQIDSCHSVMISYIFVTFSLTLWPSFFPVFSLNKTLCLILNNVNFAKTWLLIVPYPNCQIKRIKIRTVLPINAWLEKVFEKLFPWFKIMQQKQTMLFADKLKRYIYNFEMVFKKLDSNKYILAAIKQLLLRYFLPEESYSFCKLPYSYCLSEKKICST